MKRNPLPLRGHKLFVFAYSTLNTIRTKGLFAAITHYWTGWTMVLLAYGWKARQVVHWRLSPYLSQKKIEARMTVCRTCKTLKVKDDGRFPSRESLYCGSCGCKDWKWSELLTKNTRVGHYCPLGLHEGSEFNKKKKGCGNCGGGNKAAGDPSGNGRQGHPSAHSVIARGANPSVPADNLR